MTLDLVLQIGKALVEVAGFSLMGQGIVGLLAGQSRDSNFVFVLFRMIASPATKTVRAILPKAILDRFIPYITFGVLLWIWAALVIARARLLAAG
jgi:hypothetical protein